MRILTILLFILVIINAYMLLESVECVLPKIISYCDDINTYILQTAQEVAKDLRDEVGLPYFISKDHINATGDLCSKDNIHYGAVSPNFNDKTITDINIATKMIYYPNTLYNVILHEFLHTLGLNHNEGEQGMMSYAVSTSSYFGKIKNDCKKLWLSIDDLKGLKKSCEK